MRLRYSRAESSVALRFLGDEPEVVSHREYENRSQERSVRSLALGDLFGQATPLTAAAIVPGDLASRTCNPYSSNASQQLPEMMVAPFHSPACKLAAMSRPIISWRT